MLIYKVFSDSKSAMSMASHSLGFSGETSGTKSCLRIVNIHMPVYTFLTSDYLNIT